MTTEDDDDLGDLQGMRSIWGSMREADEDPPDRGLAALMAAAREKAEEMKPRASWWQRVLEQLRRPPVLALATLVLLVGGGVVISQRSDLKATAVTDERTAIAPAAPQAAGSSAVAPEPALEAANERDRAEPGEAAGEAAPRAKDTGAAPPAPPPPAEPAPPATGKIRAQPKPPAKPVANKRAVSLEEQAEGRAPALSRGVERAPAPVEAVPGGMIGGQPPSPMAIASDDAVSAAPESPKAASKSAQPARGPSSSEAEARVPTIDELVKQCEGAAARGDCAAAKNLANRIQKADPKAYRARVSTNAKITPCL